MIKSRITAGIAVLSKIGDLRRVWSQIRFTAFCIVVQSNDHVSHKMHTQMQHLGVSDVLYQTPKVLSNLMGSIKVNHQCWADLIIVICKFRVKQRFIVLIDCFNVIICPLHGAMSSFKTVLELE